MPDYLSMYFKLFAAAADAVEALERGKAGQALRLLITAQRQTEEMYLSDNENRGDPEQKNPASP